MGASFPPGTVAIDPQGRRVVVLTEVVVLGTRWLECRLAGSYGATVRYLPSMLEVQFVPQGSEA